MCWVKQDIISSCQTGIPYCVAGIIGEGGGGGGGARKSEKIPPPLFFSHFFSLTTPVLCRLAILWQTCGTAQLLQNANLAFNATSLVLGA